MCDKPYANLPAVDFDGGAGSNGPLNRETRYKPYAEKIRTNKEEKKLEQTENA
ncbi:MAG: hypothetical protein ABFC62_05170 [Clostridiaceae bacterium]|nr:hypothetical protein [Eubacteriales bacterium]